MDPMDESKGNKFSCVVIGGTSLPIRCSELLLRDGYEIRAIVSSDPEVQRWATGNGLAVLAPDVDLARNLTEPFDYIFSIVNDRILSKETLLLPRKLSINYHDSPLPRYAGTHATSWAIINGETKHGVTWHVISDKVDAGDILESQTVPVTLEDTALTLNTKCYQASIESFQRLISDLATERVVFKVQDLTNRTFFPKFKKPAHGGIISWHQSADTISALVRGLDFGRYVNPLGTPKILIGDRLFILRRVSLTDTESQSKPGTVLEVNSESIRVATCDRDIILNEIVELWGRPMSWAKVVDEFGISVGDRFIELCRDELDLVEDLVKSSCKSESYWVDRLLSLVPAYAPTNCADRPLDSKYSQSEIDRSGELSRQLHALEFPHSFVSAFLILISKLNGQDLFDVGLGKASSRDHVLGKCLFEPVVPVRVAVESGESARQCLKRIGSQIQDEIDRPGYQRDIFCRYPELKSQFGLEGGLRLPVCIFIQEEAKSDIDLTNHVKLGFVVTKENAAPKWVYDIGKISSETIARLSDQLSSIVHKIAKNPNASVSEISSVAESDLYRISTEWNNTTSEYPIDRLVHELVSDRSRSNPNSVAVRDAATKITYGELDIRSNQLAHLLRRQGVSSETIVATLFNRSVASVVAMLGVLKSGGAYLPLDPTYPSERLEFMLSDAGARVLLTQRKHNRELSAERLTTFNIESDWEALKFEDSSDIALISSASNIAYLIYTSGSTGRPKGVEIEHGSLLNLINWHIRSYRLTSNDRTTLLAGPAFDASVWELWPSLTAGASIHIPDDETRSDPRQLIKWLAENEISICFVPTPLLEAMLQLPVERLSRIRYMLTGGDRLHRITRQLPFELVNHYGPTENTVVSTAGFVEVEDETNPSIGRPIQNVKVFLLDQNLKPAPIGARGEIFVGGRSLARGYRNQPELTAQRFCTVKMGEHSYIRLYRTGDVGRYRNDGNIDFIERIDDQVKLRGFRIELGEIETILRDNELVKECAVVLKENDLHEKRLVAYVVPNSDSVFDAGKLRDALRNTLPEYMIPHTFIQKSALPITPNGKLDRKLLVEQHDPIHSASNDFPQWENPVEQRLAKIWKAVLGVDFVRRQDDFFELGGDSLSAVRMFAEIEETFGKSIPLATLFEAGNIMKLAEILQLDNWNEPESSIVPIQPLGTKPPLFCIHAKGGNVLFYRDLSRRLGTDQPFYGVQARRLAGRQVGHATVEEMAAFYIKEIKSIQPAGPYYIGGSSFGGLAAFEIAHQLQQNGDEVALLALLDTGTPDYPSMLPNVTRFRAHLYENIRRFQQHRDSLRLLKGSERIDYVLSKIARIKLKYTRKVRNSYRKTVRTVYMKLGGSRAIPKKYLQLEDKIWRAGQKYVPKPYSGKVTLFVATVQPLGIIPDPSLGWRPFVDGELEIHEVPGHHGSIVKEPFVGVLAAKLSLCISRTLLEPTPPAIDISRSLKTEGRYEVAGV